MRHTIELTAEDEKGLGVVARALNASVDEVLEALIQATASSSERIRLIGATRKGNAGVSLFKRLLEGQKLDDDLPIRSTPGVMGGDACIRSTRIPVWTLVSYKQQGMSDEELLFNYPQLTSVDLDAAWDYFAAHTEEVEAQGRRHEEAA